MLELYHNINSVCAQKIRLALAEKGLTCQDNLMKLNGDQFDPAYLKLNPNGVVPTLIHDGQAITESAVILYYLDEVFPAPEARRLVERFGRVGRDIATSASRRTGRDTLASSSSHQANMPVIPSSQCTNSLRRLTAMDSINRPACIFAPL